jgi:hypothetical protein
MRQPLGKINKNVVSINNKMHYYYIIIEGKNFFYNLQLTTGSGSNLTCPSFTVLKLQLLNIPIEILKLNTHATAARAVGDDIQVMRLNIFGHSERVIIFFTLLLESAELILL